MIIAIAFFSLSAAVCTNLFVSAHLTSEETRTNNMAMLRAQSVVECFKVTDGSAKETVQLLSAIPHARLPGTYILYYDKDWQQVEPVSGAVPFFYVTFSVDESASPKTITIDVSNSEQETDAPVYQLSAKKYVSGRGA